MQRKGLKGAVDRVLARHLEKLIAVPGSKLYKQFARACHDVEATQLAVLDEILTYSRDTEFGRAHGFAQISGPGDYQRAFDTMDYEAHRPYIDRHKRGESDVLFPGKPLMYNRSSGTTAKPKYIPVTPYNFKRTIKNRSKLWLYGLARDFPGIYRGKDLTLVSPAVEGYTEDRTPYGSLSGLVYQNIPAFMNVVHTIPQSTMTIADYDAKIYTLLRCSLAHDVTVILTGNPSTVYNLVANADAHKEAIIRDIHDGTLNRDLKLEPNIRAELEAELKPNPRRAAELDRLAATTDQLRPADYWPNLKLVHTWKNGNCRLVIPKLRPWFLADTPILDFGYLASEINAADLIDPETDGSILSILNGFYEFQKAGDGDPNCDRYYLAHELEVGERYYIYVTTFSGLYRYDMNDVLEVVGKFKGAPILKFMFKGKGITSIEGEKLSEEQLIEAVHSAAQTTHMRHDFFVGFANAPEQTYQLYIEFLKQYTPPQIERFGRAVDHALHEVNVEYEAKRKSQRLNPLQVVPVYDNFFERYRAMRLAEGAYDGQIKWLQLSATDADRSRLEKICAE